ncbi:MAG: ECF transporter S component [Ruminiclostridium sp.]|nr:ECF transporter S component [Ruminiclostridium sp.]
MKNTKIRFITITAILGALATVLQMFEFPIPVLIPNFVKFDFSDLPAILATFLVSPISGVAVCLIKNVIHIATSNSAGIGELANFLTSVCCVLPAGIIYKLKPTKKMAVVAMLIGSLVSGFTSIFINYFITYPFYMNAMGFPLEAILGMYKELNGSVVTLWDCLIWFNAPFTFMKFMVCSVIVFFIYKPLSKAIKKTEA